MAGFFNGEARGRELVTYRPLTLAGVGRGGRDLVGAIIPVLAFGIGIGFGAAAANVGLSPAAALTMSGLVFAGASQYAALELWSAPLPILSLLILTVAINARHLVLGATLHAYLADRPAGQRLVALALLSDSNWAATQQAIVNGEQDLGHLVGGGLVLWTAWLLGTGIGAVAGAAVGDLDRFGVDIVMPAFFACALIPMIQVRGDVPPWLVAGLAAAGSSMVLPIHWAVLAGAFTGAVTGVMIDARR